MADVVGQLEIKLGFNTKSMDQGLNQAEQKISKTGQAMQTALGVLAANAVQGMIGKIGDLASSIMEVGKNFESSMSEVAAISGAAGKDLQLLEKTARDFGASTQFSASEAADALKYMSLAGWDANQSASALGGVLDLAAASGMALAQSSDLVTDYLSAFGMEANQSAYFADLLSYAQANSNTTAEALGEAYKNCAANLSAAGQDIETTTSLLSMMANQGLKGSEAGTALNAVMRDMTAKMEDGAIAIGNTKVQVMDANGNYRDMTDILLEVEAATRGMGDAERAAALQSTFTSDSIKGLNLIMNAGVSEAAGFEEALRESAGTASDMAAVMNDNLEGRLKSLNSKFEELQIKIYNAVKPALEAGVSAASGLADALSWVMDNADKVIPVIGGLAAGIATYTAVTKGATIASKAWTVATNLMGAAQTALNAVLNMSPIGLIVGGITAVVTALGLLFANSEEFRNFVANFFSELGAFFGWIGEQIGQFFSSLGQWFAELPGNIANWLGQVVANVGIWVSNMVAKAVELGGQFLGAIGEFFSQLPYNLGKFLATAVLTTIQFVNDMVNKAIELGTQFVANIINFFAQLPGNIANFLTQAVANVASWVGEMIGKAVEAGTQFIQNIVNFFTQLPGKIWEFLTSTIGKVATFVGDMAGKALEAGKQFFDNLVNKVKEIPGEMLNIGKNIVEGIWNGISGAWNWLTQKIGEFCSGIVDAIKSFFGIESPSKLFRDEVGVYMAQGIGVGFTEEMSAVNSEMQDVLASNMPSMTTDASVSVTTDAQIGSQLFTTEEQRVAYVEAMTAFYQQLTDQNNQHLSNYTAKLNEWVTQTQNKVQEFTKNIISKITQFGQQMTTKAAEIGKNFYTKILEQPNKLPEKFKELGVNIIKGLEEGMRAQEPALMRYVDSLCAKIVAKMQAAMKIHSPSQVMADEVGAYMAQGVGLGFDEEMKSVSKEMAGAMPSTAIDGLNGWASAVNNIFVDDDDDNNETREPAMINQTNNIYSAFEFEQFNEELLQEIRRVA